MKLKKIIKFPQLLITNYSITIILIIAAIVRFSGLTWCFPYTPHPDEWNMAHAITQMSWQDKLNPHFFAYGQFPLYLAYFSTTLYNFIPWIKLKTINIQEAIFFLRFWSAIAGVATVYLVYLISKKIFSSKKLCTLNFALCTAALAAFTPGLIQISHFGTTESPLSFFFLLILYLCFLILEKNKTKYYIFLGIVLGLAIGAKISALIFGFPVLITFIMLIKIIKFKNFNDFLRLFGKYFLTLTFALTLALLSSPYLVLAFKESRGTLLYETSVAAGQSPVFYTRQFIDTPPIVFQLQKIFPYALGWPIFLLGIAGFVFSWIVLATPNKNKKTFNFKLQLLTLNFALLTYFLSQAFLFTKWTRFMSPLFAFFPIFAGIFLSYLSNLRNLRYLSYFIVILAIFPGILFSSIYFSPDIRFTASKWIFQNIPSGSQVLYDTGNVVDIPISSSKSLPPNPYTLNPISFDFYHLNETPELFFKLLNNLETSDYIIVPSRRIFANHLRLPEKYPLTARYYQLLFSDKLGFTQVAKIEPFYSKIFKDEQAEETFSVFDHPTIRIYKKTILLTVSDYEKLFE